MISVIIPARNEEKLITKTLEALRTQHFSEPFEVIVVNNGSTDGMVAVITTYAQQHPDFDVRIVDEPRPGIARACQTGFEAARYDILARTDADTIPAPDWLATLAGHFALPNVMAVGGSQQYEGNEAFGLGSRLFRAWHNWYGIPVYFGTNLALRRNAFETIGGFDVSLKRTEDIDISRRLWIAYPEPGQLVFDQKLRVTTSLRKYRSLRQSLRTLPLGVWAYLKNMYQYFRQRK